MRRHRTPRITGKSLTFTEKRKALLPGLNERKSQSQARQRGPGKNRFRLRRLSPLKGFGRKSFRLAGLLLSLLVLLFSSCKKENDNDLLYMLGLLQPLGDYWARLYYVDPLVIGDEENINFIREAQPSDTFPGSPKIILVSGWDTNDRSNVSYPSPNDLETRALVTNWNHLIKTNEFDQMVIAGYKIFIFDYLTSDHIETNGIRFRYWLDRTFGSTVAQEVVIYAHSMGGIVTRTAIYQGNRPAYLKAALVNGSPLHGSPWASPEFQGSLSVLGKLAAFITATDGGSDLRWDNYDGSIFGASNEFLTRLNSQSDRDDLIHLTYGEVDSGTSFESPGDASAIMVTACPILHGYGSGFPGDCIVPTRSAQLSGHTTGATPQDLGRFEHFQINWGTGTTRTLLKAKIDTLVP